MYTPSKNIITELEEFTPDQEIVTPMFPEIVRMTSPQHLSVNVGETPTLQWAAYPKTVDQRYRIVIGTGQSNGVVTNPVHTVNINTTSYDVPIGVLTASVTYYWQMVIVSPIVQDPSSITGISISGGSTIVEGQNREFTITVEGTGDFSTAYTASIITGVDSGSISQNENIVTVTANADTFPGNIEFQVVSVQDNSFTASRDLIIQEVSQDPDSQTGDEIALQDLYNAFSGDTWDNNIGWNSGSVDLSNPPVHIVVENINSELRVVEINLHAADGIVATLGGDGDSNYGGGNGLSGNAVPDSFRNLKKLRELRLKGNNIQGARIDNWIQYLDSIEYVSLSASTGYGGQFELMIDAPYVRYNHSSKNNNSYNKWSGPIPNLKHLTNLYAFECANSDLSADYLPTLPNSMRAFFITNNKIGSDANPVSIRTSDGNAWGNCVNMTHLYIGNRYDTGRYFGDIPPEWNNMQLRWINVETNHLSNFPEMPNLTDLRMIETSGARAFGPFPNWLLDDPNENQSLHTFEWSGASGSIPPTTEVYPSAVIGLGKSEYSSGLTGEVPQWFFDSEPIQFQIQNQTGITSFADGAYIGPRTKLFWVYGCSIAGPLPPAAADQTANQLTFIYCQDNFFTGPIPTSWTNFQQRRQGEDPSSTLVKRITLQNNLLSGLIPDLSVLDTPESPFESFNVSDNKFTPKDIEPNRAAISAVCNYNFSDQKNFGEAFTASVGATLDLSEFAYAGNTYSWTRNDNVINGETNNTIDTTSYGAGTYRMLIDHDNYTQTFTSEPITVS